MSLAQSPHPLLTAAQAYEDQLLSFLQDLVRIPSVNGVNNEVVLAHRIAVEADHLHLPTRLVADVHDRPNILVQWGTGTRGGFALIGHMDTVAANDPDAWSTPPFAAVIRDGRLIGRGAADNKAGIACGLYALALARDQELLDPHQVRLILAGVVDEESGAGSPHGVRYLLDQGELPVDGAIYTYAGNTICVGHRGLLRLLLEAEGKAVHTGSTIWSQGEGGVNAVTGLADVLLALEKLELAAPEHPAFSHLGVTITPGTRFAGGEFESIVPSHARALVDIRLLPGQDAKAVIAATRQVIDAVKARRPGLAIHLSVKNNLPGVAIPIDHKLVQVAAKHSQAITGRSWPVAGAGPANEGYMLIEAGIPTLPGFGPAGGNAHAPDEWVAVDSLAPTAAMYAAIMGDYCREGK